MINDFIVQAQKDNNQLYVLLDGTFMKSEIDLAFQLIKNEIQKLEPGYKVLIDIQNLDAGNSVLETKFNKYRKMLRLMGAETVKFLGLSSLFTHNKIEAGGDYSYENEWFF
jgi:hypothetical protein